MVRWKHLKSSVEWGFFFGVISWLLATGISNRISSTGVWGIILSRTLLGLIIGLVRWDLVWWARGLVLGAIVNFPLGLILVGMGIGWKIGFWPFFLSGVVFGFLIELALRHYPAEPSGKK